MTAFLIYLENFILTCLLHILNYLLLFYVITHVLVVDDVQVFNKIIYSCSSDHTARAWLKDVGELLQVYKGNDMPISRVVYHKGLGQFYIDMSLTNNSSTCLLL